MPRLTALYLLAFLLTACSEGLLREDSSPAYADGYRDGCDDGSSTASNLTGQRVRDDVGQRAPVLDQAVGRPGIVVAGRERHHHREAAQGSVDHRRVLYTDSPPEGEPPSLSSSAPSAPPAPAR